MSVDPRRLALFASAAPAIVIASSVPLVGAGLGIYVGLFVWAALGVRWWLASVVLSGVADIGMTLPTAAGAAQVVAIAAPQVQPSLLPAMLGAEIAVILAFPLVLYLAKRSLRKMLVRRLGEGRLP